MPKSRIPTGTKEANNPTRRLEGLSTLEDNRPEASAQVRMQQAMADSSRSTQLASMQRKMDGAPYQFKIKMKDSGPAERTAGSEAELRTEVTETIARADRDEIESDIRKLENSIENRKKDQRGRSANSKEYDGHQHRIEAEEVQLERLIEGKRALPKPASKPKPKEKPAPSGPSPNANPFALLEDL